MFVTKAFTLSYHRHCEIKYLFSLIGRKDVFIILLKFGYDFHDRMKVEFDMKKWLKVTVLTFFLQKNKTFLPLLMSRIFKNVLGLSV